MNVEQLIRENIDRSVHMSLATVANGKPWVCELHFAYDEDLNLYWRSLKSRRHSIEIAENPNVAGNIIDKFVVGDPVVGIYFEGTAEMLEPGDEQNKAFELLRARVNAADDALEDAAREDGHKFYKLTVKNWYAFGKFGQADGQKYTLEWSGDRA